MPTLFSKQKEESTIYIYPAAKKESVFDTYHGVTVADPYRWLENQESEETKNWILEQQKITSSFLDSHPERKNIKARIEQLLNYKKYSLPSKCGNYFYWSNEGLQNQWVLYKTKQLSAEPMAVLDPNKLSDDGTTAIDFTALTKDGSLLAYAIAVNGSDWKEVRILDVEHGTTYPEVIKQCKHSTISWRADKKGFYYNKFSAETGAEEGVYFHTLGTDQSEDQLVYKSKAPEEVNSPYVTEDGKYLLLTTTRGCSEKNGVIYKSIDSQEAFIPLFNDFDSEHSFVGNIDTLFYFLTDKNAAHKQLITIDVTKIDQQPKIIIPETSHLLDSVSIINGLLVCTYLQNAHSLVKLYNLMGAFINDIPLPTLGSASCHGNQETGSELFLSFTSFLYPPTIFKYNFTTKSLEKVWETTKNFDPELYETRQVFYASNDGTKIPMFITHKKGLPLDGNNPTLLYGYGGFNVGLTPFFSASMTHWLEWGGVFAVANIRGGGEYGPSWHDQAIIQNRQRAFDDFKSAAKWLINSKYTNPKKLAIKGGSNGGLLVGVCMQQEPELFGAVISQVPVTDMLRFHKFTAGRYWVTEYGNVDNEEDFKAMYAYSPLHTVKDDVTYPPILVCSADTDDRVVPMHSKKWVARLQEASKGKNLVLLRYETAAGHGAGKPTSKQILEVTDEFIFRIKALNVEPLEA